MPARCPECARFVSREFIAGLLVDETPCPHCGAVLTRDQFHGDEALVHAPEPLAESVRPPDLDPGAVSPAEVNGTPDPLAGWDVPSNVVDLDVHRSQRARQRRLQQAVTAGASAAVGAVVGSLVLRRRRVVGAILGAAVGSALGAASARVGGDVRGLQHIG